MATLYHQVWINAPIARLYAAIATVEGVESWWGKQTAVQTEDGLVLEHNPGPMHGVVSLKVLKTVPDKRVEWTCISRHPAASPASAWTGTHLRFDIAERDNVAALSGFGRDGEPVAVLDFRHSGWDEGSPFLGFCNFAWGQVLNGLKGVCEAR
jgi:uncharacterized protein YndB with AHSA1/START domain